MHKTVTSTAIPVIVGILLAACSGGGAAPAWTSAPAAATSAPAIATASTGASAGASASMGGGVMVAESALGQILTDESGRTLYGFTKDTGGTPSCYNDCAKAWPALVTTGELSAGTGLDQGKLTTVARTDGTMQVKYGDWPLYYWAKDTAPGQTGGQGVCTIWFVVAPTGELIQTTASPSAS